MILIISSRDDVTADLVQEKLKTLGAGFLRFNSDDYPSSATILFSYTDSQFSGEVTTAGHRSSFADITTVWFRKPGLPGVSGLVTHIQARKHAEEESQASLSGLYNVLDSAFWVSRPERIRRGNDKLLQLSVAQKLGFEIPHTLVTNDPNHARAFFRRENGRVIIKPLRSGIIEYPDGMVEVIYSTPLSDADLDHFDSIAHAPCLLQGYVEKDIELRVTVIGRKLFCVGLDTQSSDVSRHDWRRDNASGVRYFPYQLPSSIAARCLAFMDSYGLQFSALDLIKTPDGRFVFLENNPNGQWAWLDLEIGNGMIQAMADFLASGGTCDHI